MTVCSWLTMEGLSMHNRAQPIWQGCRYVTDLGHDLHMITIYLCYPRGVRKCLRNRQAAECKRWLSDEFEGTCRVAKPCSTRWGAQFPMHLCIDLQSPASPATRNTAGLLQFDFCLMAYDICHFDVCVIGVCDTRTLRCRCFVARSSTSCISCCLQAQSCKCRTFCHIAALQSNVLIIESL